MSDIAIRVEGLGKRYRIGERERYKALRDVISDAAAAPFRKLRSTFTRKGHSSLITHDSSLNNGNNHSSLITHHSSPENGNGHSSLITHDSSLLSPPSDLFWALKDVSFEVKRGEVVGIIGRNGAGKSTLLKILSRITAPTEGEVEIKGRVGSLLEVGTGFHPELTGRENIYLNGAILGMKRAEIKRKFDEMVAFAEIEKFIDTPVKRYSSGMYVRLAFAVAAHLEPEILVVDEVLAVGDAAFQKKCLGKMGDVAKEGRTVLFVSHNMAAIQNLCDTAILLYEGRNHATGKTAEVVSEYIRLQPRDDERNLRDNRRRRGRGRIQFNRIEILNGDASNSTVSTGDDVSIRLHYDVASDAAVINVVFSIAIYTTSGQVLFYLANDMVGRHFPPIAQGGSVTCRIPRLPLSPGLYDININCDASDEVEDWIPCASRINVIEGDFFGTGRLPPRTHGGLLTSHQWEIANGEAPQH